MDGNTIFRNALTWLRRNYFSRAYFEKRDLVYTVQRIIETSLHNLRHPQDLRVFSGFPMIPGKKQPQCADLVLVYFDRKSPVVSVAAEFRFEPNPARAVGFHPDVVHSELPIVNWKQVGTDVRRAQRYVREKRARHAYSILIDEGGHWANREAHAESEWSSWQYNGAPDIGVLYSEFHVAEDVSDKDLEPALVAAKGESNVKTTKRASAQKVTAKRGVTRKRVKSEDWKMREFRVLACRPDATNQAISKEIGRPSDAIAIVRAGIHGYHSGGNTSMLTDMMKKCLSQMRGNLMCPVCKAEF